MICFAIIGEEGKVDVDKIVAAAKGGVGSQESGVRSREQSLKKQKLPNQQQTTQQPVTSDQQSATNGRVKASPLAKKLAAEKGIDINKLPGSR